MEGIMIGISGIVGSCAQAERIGQPKTTSSRRANSSKNGGLTLHETNVELLIETPSLE
jgi:hypothetical protein